MKTSRVLMGFVTGGLLVVGVGCSAAAKKPVYDPSQTGQIIREERGEIIAVQDVVISPADIGIFRGGPGRQIGTAVGRAVVTGSVIGAAAAIGGVVGGELGSKVDQKAGEEITIRIAGTEEVIIVVQERGDIPLAVGERVRVQTASTARGIRATMGGGNVRVVRESSQYADATQSAGLQRHHRPAPRLVSQ